MIHDKKRIGASAAAGNMLSDSSSQAKIRELENEIATLKVRSGEDLKMAESMTGIAEGLKTRLANSEKKAREMLSYSEEAQKILQQILKDVATGPTRAHKDQLEQKGSKIPELEAQMSRAPNDHAVLMKEKNSKIFELEMHVH